MRAFVLVLLCASAGCFGPKYPSGKVPCAATDMSCPSGQTCGADGLCYDTSRPVDECAAKTDKCDANATCTDAPAGYTCACKAGYIGSGFTCTDVDECMMGIDACDQHATCTNTPGSYTCACNSGFTGDGRICSDIDECQMGTDNCDVHASCLNNPGSFVCSCNTGYTGDGVTCASAWTGVTAGWGFSCAVRATGDLWCWGSDSSDQLGDNDTAMALKSSPEQIGADTDWKAISAGESHTCGLRGSGLLFCWGDDYYGELGDGTSGTFTPVGTPEAIAASTTWDQISTGGIITCAIDDTGALWCWGYGGGGALGAGNTNPATTPQKVSAGPWSSVSAGYDHVCALAGGHLYCWGENGYGQLATGDELQKNAPSQIGSALWTAVSAGEEHTCAIRADGTLWCWGEDYSGQVGDGMSGSSAGNRLAPSAVLAGQTFTAVAAGASHSCAIDSTGKLWCWGNSASGQVGGGTLGVQATPVAIGTDTDWKSVSAGLSHTCATKTDGRIFCWGDNQSGEIGLGVGGPVFSPTNTNTGSDWLTLDAGEYADCGVKKSDRSLWCWGWNYEGTLGVNHDDGSIVDAPENVDPGAAYADIAPGFYHSCGVRTDGSLRCWGDDGYGELGDGAISATPIDAPEMIGPDSWLQVVVGSSFSCGIESDGSLWCWGDDSYGEVGDPAAPNPAPAPHAVGAEKTWTLLAAGGTHACGIKSGALYCWGSNTYGEAGQSPIGGTVTAPRQVGTDTDWTFVVASAYNTCGLRGTQLSCWGDDSNGQLGDGDTAAKAVPVRVGSAAWTDVALADDHVCSVRVDGAIFCWGSNYYGALGDGTTNPSVVPEQIDPSVSWSAVASGSGSSTCALDTTGGLWCWGAAWSGQLANGATYLQTPQQLP
jgi:alpha-tubulin suppressor-like RCC1 family protein